MNKSTQNILITTLVIAGSITAIYLVSNKDGGFSLSNNTESIFKSVAGVSEASKQIEETFEKAPKKEYQSASANVQFVYPENYKIGEFDERGGRMILIQDSENNTGMQFFVTEFDEPNLKLTEDRIKQDIPDLDIQNTQYIKVSNRNIPAVIFSSTNAISGPSIEVWFVYGNKLYQISTLKEHATLSQKVLDSISFLN